jgi:4-amino-4-deoxy-L-arabinose transferase-like glycosyltransferase
VETGEEEAGAATVLAVRGGLSRALHFWRSPSDQPRWARPALLCIAALAAFSYAYGNTGLNLETFYAAAVRSMSESWHNFFFASFDPWGTVSMDKLPGSFWLQALSLRIFGFHLWALVLPQVVEGTLTVLVLFRVVRRVAGAGAGVVAALALAVSPVTVLLNRGNVSDTLLVLLLVLAADAALRASTSGRWQPLALAGVWVGLAFQAKMLQAWLVLPVFAAIYIMAAPLQSMGRRCGHVVVMGLAALVVSISWMSAVALVPAHDRPYADGSCDNSVFSQVFLYNGTDRLTGNTLDQPGCRLTSPPVLTAARHPITKGVGTVSVSGGLGKFLSGTFGRLDAWLFIPTVVALIGLLRWRRGQPRNDPLRAATMLWTGWLVLTWLFFNESSSLNSYYLSALIPPMAALCGMGLAAAWHHRLTARAVRVALGLAALAAAVHGLALLPANAGVRGWVLGVTAVLAVGTIALLASSWREGSGPAWAMPATFGFAVAAVLIGPAWASATSVAADLGPFDTPYQAVALTNLLHHTAETSLVTAPARTRFAAGFPGFVAPESAETSAAVSFDILVTGREFLPVGGFTGRVPTPTLSQFIAEVRAGKIALVDVAVQPLTTNPDLLWARTHCARVLKGPLATYRLDTVRYQRYICPSDPLGAIVLPSVP